MRKYTFLFLTVLFIKSSLFAGDTINLSGTWSFKADPKDIGITEKWFWKDLDETVLLPGSMTTNGKGDEVTLQTQWTGSIFDSSWFYNPAMAKYREPGNIKIPFWLQPVKYYVGAAWYQKSISIDKNWTDQNIELYFERCHWETRVWVDDAEIGMRNSLSTPHIYILNRKLSPGIHKISVRVDNRIKDINVGPNSHSISDHTQSNWNGIIGKLELRVIPRLHIENVKVYPNVKERKVTVRFTVVNSTGHPASGKILIFVKPDVLFSSSSSGIYRKEVVGNRPMVSSAFATDKDSTQIQLDYPMGENPMLWDEFHPNLYSMVILLQGEKFIKGSKIVHFGMRDFKAQGTQFSINGRLTFLRGTLECAIFPLTGYPPTDTASWMRIYRIVRTHGLNHIRFHSWCPPEAAFEAADHVGFYLQVECPSWANWGTTIGDGLPIDQFIYDESERIVAAYGNHPSFCMLLYGNEPGGKSHKEWLSGFVSYWKKKDPRRLYSSGGGWPILDVTDFNSTSAPRIQAWGKGLKSIINSQPPCCDYDWSSKIDKFNKPTISHEIGQWCVYPDFKEMSQYTGVLKPKNFEIFKETLENNHMGQLADSFLLASGKLQALCYKADIEAALRTRNFGGFQLLDLHDFPGQGTALVGVLNPFWREKGYISPTQYNRFCNSTVPLVRLPRMIYKSCDTLKAPVEIANFGEKELSNMIPVWKLVGADGKTVFEGKFMQTNIPIGNGIKLGDINQPLANIKEAQKLTLRVMVDKYENEWDIWVYPAILPNLNNSVWVTQILDDKAADVLNHGGNVLLTIRKGNVKPDKGGNIAIGFSSIFWNTAWTKGQAPHTLGILCNPKHPALASFPTEYHSNWQWWDAMSHSNAIILSDFSPELRPIVRIIDDWFTNRPLALIFEAKVGKGKLLVSGVDLIQDASQRPAAENLLYSLKNYMSGKAFNPITTIEIEKIKALFE